MGLVQQSFGSIVFGGVVETQHGLVSLLASLQGGTYPLYDNWVTAHGANIGY
jgi:hypothetical protein